VSARAGATGLGAAWRTIQRGSKSFAGASRLMDARTREAAWLLYAWCRHCDDAIDGETLGRPTGRPADPAAVLEALTAKTGAALRGDPVDDPAFAGLQEVARAYAIPRRYPFELLDGFAMDVTGRRYRTFEDVESYSYHVAGTVGLMMAYVMGASREDALRPAASLGIALQLTNIARDVVDDARAGRVYLPEEWLAEAGVPADEVLDPRHRAALARVTARLLDAAEPYYQSADAGLPLLPLRSAWSVIVARGVYAEIGRVVRRRGARAWDQRAVVGRVRKASWIARGLLEALATRRGRAAGLAGVPAGD
jgi:phytoene synthase